MGRQVTICKLCGNYEYWGEMRWLNGKCMCRKCYKSEYQKTYHKFYKWNDLNGPTPTYEEYEESARVWGRN